MELRPGRIAGRFGFALVATVALLGASPAGATSRDSQANSFQEQLESAAAALKAKSERAIAAASEAAQRMVEDNKETIDDAKSDLTARLQSFRALLNEQKAKLGMIGEDVAAKFDVWTQQAAQTWAETHRSALEALDWLQNWLEQHSGTHDEPIDV